MLTLHAVRSGSGQQAVVLLHGLFGSASNLGLLARALEADFTVYRVDLRNHGRSFQLDDMDLPAMADDVARLLSAEGLERAHLVGHSLGGKVAMQLALNRPERVASLVVADIAPIAYPRHHDAILAALQGIDLRALKNREQADQALKPAVDEAGVRQFLLKNLARDNGGWQWRMNLPALAANYDALRAAPSGEPYIGPVLFIKGEESDYITEEARGPIMRLFPGCQVKVIQGAGHWLHADKPAVFNRLVLRFLLESSRSDV